MEDISCLCGEPKTRGKYYYITKAIYFQAFKKNKPILNTEARIQRPFTTEELNELILDSIQDIKGKNIIKMDLRRLEDAPTDFFFICEGDSSTQVQAIADNVQLRLKREAATLPSHVEGMQSATWVCLDYFDVVVHVFYRETRGFYRLEDLWSDAQTTEYSSL